jgi:hypothetical protein
MSRTRAPDRRDPRGSLRASATALGVRLAGRRAFNAHYVVGELADQPIITDLEFARKAERGLRRALGQRP